MEKVEEVLSNGHNGHHHLESVVVGATAAGESNDGKMKGDGLNLTTNSTSDRIKRKAKRINKFLAKEINTDSPSNLSSRLLKNSRKSRNGHGRGLPKKGGAGGKGTWGAYGSELKAVAALDYKDPNYDSESLENGDIHLEAIIPQMASDELLKQVEGIILEYFEHGDTSEVIASLEDLPLGHDKYKVIVVAIEAAMDHKPSHREMASHLISELVEESLNSEDVIKAFEVLLDSLDELILDVPEAPLILANFMARSVADDCMLLSSVHSFNPTNEHAKTAICNAESLLGDKIGILRLNNVWGVGGGAQPVKALSRRIDLLLKEFISSKDTTEAGRCLRELEVPHFHHELVYEAIVMALEGMSESLEEEMCRLLKALSNQCIITPDQMQRGFYRVFEDLPDLTIDVPAAYILIERLVSTAQRHGIITDEIARNLPVRGRKRFVSEGDGGKEKPEILNTTA